MNRQPNGDLWGNLVADICEEFQNGTLDFSDAVEDLLFLGFDMDKARERLQADLESRRPVSEAPKHRNDRSLVLERRRVA